MNRKPDYILIGASKCATSSICSLLGQHPDVFMTEPKEPQFFAIDEVYNRGFEWYQSLFESVTNEKVIGEGSNLYTMKEVYPNAYSRLIEYAPDVKLIYCVRNPIPRIESYWLEKRTHGGEEVHYDFNTAVRVNRDHLVDSSNYWKQINVYREFFPDEKIHIIFFEEFKKDPKTVIRACLEFLNVDTTIMDTAIDFSTYNTHLGQTSGRLVPKDFFSKIRSGSNPIYKFLVNFIPFNLRQELKNKFLFQPIASRPEWNPETKSWVTDILEGDNKKFLEFYGKPADFWS